MDDEEVVWRVGDYGGCGAGNSGWEQGDSGVIRKPFKNEQILALAAKGIRKRRKEEERQSLRQAMVRSVNREGFIGRSDVMENVFRQVEREDPDHSNVLSTWKSGTWIESYTQDSHETKPRT